MGGRRHGGRGGAWRGGHARRRRDGDAAGEGSRAVDGGSTDEESDDDRERTVAVRLALWELSQTDVRRDTGSQLCRKGLCERVRVGTRFPGVVLSPRGRETISPADGELVARYGLGVVNCSWARLDDVPFGKLKSGGDRLLPFLVASNPTKYGQPFVLSSAEAHAAGLVITGHESDARAVMSCFRWGDSFWQMNGEMLRAYAACKDGAEVVQAQQRFMREIEAEREARVESKRDGADGYASFDLPPSGSSDEEEEGEELEQEASSIATAGLEASLHKVNLVVE